MTKKEAIKILRGFKSLICQTNISHDDYLDYKEAIRVIDEQINKYKWHDLQKNPDDLPEKFKDVYVCVLNRGKKTYNRTWLDGYAWRNATSKRATHYQKGSVIAWREIDQFEGVE